MVRWKKILLVIIAVAIMGYLVWRCATPDDEDFSWTPTNFLSFGPTSTYGGSVFSLPG